MLLSIFSSKTKDRPGPRAALLGFAASFAIALLLLSVATEWLLQRYITPQDTQAAHLRLLAVADNADAASQLIDFLLGPSGQQYFANETFEYPLAAGEAPAGNVPAIDFSDVGGIAFETLGGGLEHTRTLIAEAGLDG